MCKYEKPEMEILEIRIKDVIRTSSVTENGTIEKDETSETPFVPRF